MKREDLVQKFITQPPSKELNQIQHQLNLVLEKLDAIQTRTNTENNPSINFAPSLNVNALKLDYGSEIFRKLMLDQTNVKEMPFMQHMI